MNPGKAETDLHDEAACGFRCNICGYFLDESYGGYLYLKNNNGVRVPLKDKDEQEAVAQILLSEEESAHNNNWGCFQEIIDVIEERVGYMSACICLKCLDQFGLDLRKDAILCPHCKSDHVRTFLELADKRCPKCQSGHINRMGYEL